MTKKEWQQYSFLPPVHQDIGVAEKPKKHRRRTNPDTKAVFDFMKRQSLAVYELTASTPQLRELTPHKQEIYWGIKRGERKRAAAWIEQDEAERKGLTGETFYLDTEIPLERRCGDCTSFFSRTVRIQKPGRGKRADQTKLLVNEYCPSCGFTETGREYHFWVQNSQVIKRG